MIKKLFLLGLLISTTLLWTKAQTIHSDTLTVLQIAQEEGLSQLGASSLQFDNKGYLWVGTQNGLNRFNGYQMKVWLADEHSNLPDDHIRAMYQANDTLWLSTNTHAICAYLLAENRFIHFSEELDLKKNPFLKYSHVLYACPTDIIIAGTIGHCILIDRKHLNFEILPVPQILENDFVTSIQSLNGNFYLIGTNASGLYLLNTDNKEIYSADYLSILQHTQINALYRTEDGNVLVGTADGLFTFAVKEKTLTQKNKRIIRSIHRWDDTDLLIGGMNENFLLNNDRQSWRKLVFIDHIGKELSADILSYQEDAQGGKWIGTESRGIFYYHPYQTKFRPQRIQTQNAPKKDYISTFNFLRDRDDLWMATEFGFVRHRLHSDTYKLYRTDFLEYTLTKDAKGTIWAGGFGQGLLRYNRTRDNFTPVRLPFVDKDIIQITPVAPDSLWIHTWSSGIYSLNINNFDVHPVTLFEKGPIRSRASHVDRQGNIWVGSEAGLHQVNKDRKVIFYDSLSNERVFAIAEDSKHHMWVGTAKGLNHVDPSTGKIKHYTKQAGLPNDFIYGVQVDDIDRIWVSTNYGISVLDNKTHTFRNYTEEDGLQNNEFNGKAAYQDSLGYLYFGGMNGFNVFHPDSIYSNKHTGRTHIENVLLFGRHITNNTLYTDTLIFSHDQNVITFDFVNLNYLWSKKNRYQFILEGFDKEWRPVTRDRSTTYTNLAPGTYTFKVRGSNNELLWGDTDEMTIIIRSPWYATWAFRIGMGLLLLLIIFGSFLYKTHQQRKTNLRLKRMVEARTEELSEANKALHVSLNTTEKQKENISFLMQELNHRVKNNLQLITSLIDIQSFEIPDQDIQDKLRILQSRVFTVSKIHDILNVRDTERGVSAKDFIHNLAQDLITFSGQSITLHHSIDDMILPSNKLTYLGLVLNELITNSLKHAFKDKETDKIIHVSLHHSDVSTTITYRDNGIGFDLDHVIGVDQKGITLIRLLIKELKGTFETHMDNGTIFTVNLPKN